MYCIYCGNPITDGSAFCDQCGASIQDNTTTYDNSGQQNNQAAGYPGDNNVQPQQWNQEYNRQRLKIEPIGVVQRIAGAILAAVAVFVALNWLHMPYLFYDWYGEDLNVILHIITFAACPVLCILTFLFAEKKKKICFFGGIVVLVLAIVSTLVNEGFVPYEGTQLIGFISVLYLIIAFASLLPGKNERYGRDGLKKKHITAVILSMVFAALAVFAIVYPKQEEIFTQHMYDDGPGMIEYFYQYTEFGYFLTIMTPIILIILVLFVTRAALLHGQIKKLR